MERKIAITLALLLGVAIEEVEMAGVHAVRDMGTPAEYVDFINIIE